MNENDYQSISESTQSNKKLNFDVNPKDIFPNIVRTLPINSNLNIEATPIVDYKDILWTEIDALDDVKRMARNQEHQKGFSDDFEVRLDTLRKIHAGLLSTIQSNPSQELEAQNEHINKLMKQMQLLRKSEDSEV